MTETRTTTSHRQVVSYIDKSREYYAAQGYETPYEWATFEDVPFHEILDLGEATVGVVTTAYPSGHTGRKDAFVMASAPTPDDMFTDDLSWDKDATNTDDVGSFLPLDQLRSLAKDGTIGAASDRFYGVPTVYSQRATKRDADRVLQWAREDGVDAVLLVPL